MSEETARTIPQTASRPAPFGKGSLTGGTDSLPLRKGGGAANAATEGLSAPAAFNYDELPAQTVAVLQSAEHIIQNGYRVAKVACYQIADAVGMAHDELVYRVDKRANQYTEEVFGKWCESVGISRPYAYQLLQVSNFLTSCTPNEQETLKELPFKLLRAVSQKNAPPALVDKVKSGDIATHKAYQAALAESKEKDRRIERLERTVREKDKQIAAGASTQEQLRRRSAQYNEAAAERDAWKARAEELEARPVEVAVEVDEAEVERRATEKAQALADAMLRDRGVPPDPEQTAHDAYDAGLQFWRTIDNAWRLARPRVVLLAPNDRQAIYQKYAEIFDKVRKDMT